MHDQVLLVYRTQAEQQLGLVIEARAGPCPIKCMDVLFSGAAIVAASLGLDTKVTTGKEN
ncbi:MAG: hypothetical protein LAP87_16870 [Acidobacteriia bacterium]|nr:hypothetical protein [Terriglobia bacterium]